MLSNDGVVKRAQVCWELALRSIFQKWSAAMQVFQVRRKGTGQVYAMKVMRKERILARDHGDYVRAEREVLTAVFHPYIVTLRCSFQVMRST